jgi:cytochrome c1-like protein
MGENQYYNPYFPGGAMSMTPVRILGPLSSFLSFVDFHLTFLLPLLSFTYLYLLPCLLQPLYDESVEYEDGTPNNRSQLAYDVTNFLWWAAEPEHDERKQVRLVPRLCWLRPI